MNDIFVTFSQFMKLDLKLRKSNSIRNNYKIKDNL